MSSLEEINNETDNENTDTCVGYYTRSKRRKLEKDDDKFISVPDTIRKRKNIIAHLPTEVLQSIFRHLSFKELCEVVRLVNRRFKLIAEDILNRTFKQIEKKFKNLIESTELSLQCTRDDIELKCLLKLLNMLEILKLQYSLVHATVWRYVYNDYYKIPTACFYAGQLLDAIYDFIHKFLHCPNLLYGPAVAKDYFYPTEVTKIIQLAKTFCIHFDKVVEEPSFDCSNRCKMVDILDCALYAQKTVIFENDDNDILTAEYNYFFRNGWFVALPITTIRHMEPSQKQRFMHMRLRRIVLAHSDMFLQQCHYEREVIIRPEPTHGRPKKPGNNVYTGYGDVGNVFFYYGVMNDGSYVQKFNIDDDQYEEDSDDEVRNNQAVLPRTSDEDIFYEFPYLGFTLNVRIKCPLKQAPLRFLQKLSSTKQRNLKDDILTRTSTYLKLVFNCEGACYPRLPTRYEYNIL